MTEYKNTTSLGMLLAYEDNDEEENTRFENQSSSGNHLLDQEKEEVTKTFSSIQSSGNSLDEPPRKILANSQKLPSPLEVSEMFRVAQDDPIDDPDLHEGRSRSFPHKRGNWSSFVYIPFKSFREDEDNFERLIQYINLADKRMESQIHGIREPHLSLSKTVVLRHHWICPFKTSLQNKLLDLRSRVELIFDKFEIYVNEEKTRTFLGMRVLPTSPLLDVVKICDFCLSEFNLEPYYENPSFHISLAWMVGDQSSSEALLGFTSSVSDFWDDICDHSSVSQHFSVDRIEFKTGGDIYSFLLRDN